MLKVTLEKTVISNTRYVRVIGLEALPLRKLPMEYIGSGYRCWLTDDGKAIVVITPTHRVRSIRLNSIHREDAILFMKRDLSHCGDHLVSVNKKRKEVKEEVPEKESFSGIVTLEI